MAIRIMDDTMTLEIDNHVVATARFSEYAAADGHGAWIVSTHPARLFSRNQAITALTLAERLAIGYGDDDPFVVAAILRVCWRPPRTAKRPAQATGRPTH
jgi:hypothetical protein